MSGKRGSGWIALVLGVALLVGAACVPAAETPVGHAVQPGEGGPGEPTLEVEPTETPEEEVSVEDPLAGSEWSLIEYGPQGALAKTLSISQVTIRFENGVLGGTAGCNSYAGSYQVSGELLELGPFDITDMCEYHVELESIYLGMLETAVRFSLTADELVLHTAEGLLVFARPEVAVADLVRGPVWVLEAIVSGGRGQTVLAGTRLTFKLDDTKATGETGCNYYGADYTLEGESFSVGPAEMTQQDCGHEIMAQEALFLSMLGAAQGLRLEDGRLVIATADGQLVFRAGKDRPLEGTIWTLGGIAKGGAVVSTWVDGGITAKFGSGQVTGDAGCNQYFATYETDGGALHFGPAGRTEMACADEERMARENEFLAALEWVFGYQIQLDELTLLDPEGKPLMILTAAPPASISGRIAFDTDLVDPGLRVYAREVNTGQLYWINPGEGNMTYTIPDLPPGTYVVVGWFHPLGASGAYTSLDTVMADGVEQQQACEGAIVEIELQPGEAYAGADIGCWGGDFFGLVE
jgi:heat shock protein HslJ